MDFRLVTMIAMTIVARTELDVVKLESLCLKASEYMNQPPLLPLCRLS